ncbi:hypothetical protein [Streptomyces sp. RKAG337]|uniref:hypothetical protein n=1 Tax=Streptomyces sp. RKAG337 TaxID=2893404 RepID=UPI00203342F9|nr:hypothetical protein [Streptomyces sp. RKAG337]MCM2431000.1 hypothetical protein [Streptomyces sp. RKAG337]
MQIWEKRTVLMPHKPLGLCEDKLADAMATALYAIEAREGERRGWDRPARLFTVHLADHSSRSIELRVIPARAWNSRDINPADALTSVARNLPQVPADLHRREYADSPVAGAALMFEGWGRPGDREATEYERRAGEMGMRVNHLAPDRIESRCVYGVDINQQQIHVFRTRGEKARVYSSAVPGSDRPASGSGRIPDALNRIVHALREGRSLF